MLIFNGENIDEFDKIVDGGHALDLTYILKEKIKQLGAL